MDKLASEYYNRLLLLLWNSTYITYNSSSILRNKTRKCTCTSTLLISKQQTKKSIIVSTVYCTCNSVLQWLYDSPAIKQCFGTCNKVSAFSFINSFRLKKLFIQKCNFLFQNYIPAENINKICQMLPSSDDLVQNYHKPKMVFSQPILFKTMYFNPTSILKGFWN